VRPVRSSETTILELDIMPLNATIGLAAKGVGNGGNAALRARYVTLMFIMHISVALRHVNTNVYSTLQKS